MELRLAIVDDLAADRERLAADLRSFLAQRADIELSLHAYTSAEELLACFKPEMFDVVFLDICMSGLNGVELAERLREGDARLLIIFLTTSREYAFDAFPVHPFDYLIKPYDVRRLKDVLSEALRTLALDEPTVSIRIPRGSREVTLDTVSVVEARGHAVEVTLADGQTLRSIMTFSELEKLLTRDPRFLRCNRGLLINMDHVTTLEGDSFRMNGGQTCPMRVRSRNELVDTFSQYMLSRLEKGTGR